MAYWLMKSEPDVYSIDDLARDGRTFWEGVRNFQARNLMRDQMKAGDGVLVYHSSTDPPGVAGIAELMGTAYPDPFAFDPDSPYFDPKSNPDDPRWLMVDLAFVEKFPRLVTLDEIRRDPGLGEMVLVKNSRLSVQPVSPDEYRRILELARR
jgi:predicted RNA-binding protein with PUA-like domain